MRLFRSWTVAVACPVLMFAAGVSAPAAQASEDLYQVLRAPMFLQPKDLEYPEFLLKRQAAATSDLLKRIQDEQLAPGLVTRDIPSPFSSSLRNQAGYYQATGLEPSR